MLSNGCKYAEVFVWRSGHPVCVCARACVRERERKIDKESRYLIMRKLICGSSGISALGLCVEGYVEVEKLFVV